MLCFVSFGMLLSLVSMDPLDARSYFSHMRMPAHGSVYKGVLYGFFDDEWSRRNTNGRLDWSQIPVNGVSLEKTDKVNWKKYEFLIPQYGFNHRHHIEFGCVWVSFGPASLIKLKYEDLHNFESDPRPRGMSPAIVLPTLGKKYDKFISEQDPAGAQLNWFPAASVIGYGSVPTSKDSCKCYMLVKKTKKLEVWENNQEHKSLEALDSVFMEDFYFFLRKDAYYFVTESGKLYHAPPPIQGEKSRTMKALWDDAKRPIVAVIEDADRDKVWLFAKDKNAGAKNDLYFEMKDTIKTEAFDPAKLRPVNVEGRAKVLLEYLPLISPMEKK